MSKPSPITLHVPGPYIPFAKRTGKLTFTLTNDYLFKVVLQKNEDILRSLLCSLLGLPSESIHSITIANAAEPGVTVEDKDAILDIKLILNHQRILNIEMQVKNEYNWPERSLTYLCRSFDNVPKGQDYRTVLPTHHIGILHFSLNGMPKQFYSHYYLMEQQTHNIYTHKFRLSVLDLTQAALATESDRQRGLDLWAAAFRATTWEEFHMLAEKDPLFEKVSDALYIVLENRELAEQIRRKWDAEAARKRMEEEQKRMAEETKRMAEETKRMAEDQKRMTEEQQRMAEETKRMAEDQKRLETENAALKAKLAQFETDHAKNIGNC